MEEIISKLLDLCWRMIGSYWIFLIIILIVTWGYIFYEKKIKKKRKIFFSNARLEKVYYFMKHYAFLGVGLVFYLLTVYPYIGNIIPLTQDLHEQKTLIVQGKVEFSSHSKISTLIINNEEYQISPLKETDAMLEIEVDPESDYSGFQKGEEYEIKYLKNSKFIVGAKKIEPVKKQDS